MSQYLIIDIYSDKKMSVTKIKEGEECFKLWENALECLKNDTDCTEKFFEWDKCQLKYKKK
tara:strand:- start:2515 stop:2697 length:183 start_codon:yes stop_codon:yes gene_type:complete